MNYYESFLRIPINLSVTVILISECSELESVAELDHNFWEQNIKKYS